MSYDPRNERNGNGHLTRIDALTAQFYDWELRGRGWQLWDKPVELEPPFAPFLGHYVSLGSPIVDDARKPTFWSALIDSAHQYLHRRRAGAREPTEPTANVSAGESPQALVDDEELVEVQVLVPPSLRIVAEAAERFLLGLTYIQYPVSLEFVACGTEITLLFACRRTDYPLLRPQLAAHFPDTILRERLGFLSQSWSQASDAEPFIVEFGLSEEFMRPLRTFDSFEIDPLVSIVAALGDLRNGESAVIQCLFQSARAPWGESVLRAVTDEDGDSFFVNAPEMVRLSRVKIARPLFAAVLRVAAKSPQADRGRQIARTIGASFAQFADPLGNELIPLANDEYDSTEHEEDLLCRRTRRSGMLLNSEELLSLVHLPSASVRCDRLVRKQRKTKAAPATATGHQLFLGENEHAGEIRAVSLSTEERLRHAYVIGASGTGKSTLMLNLILQDIENGEGVGVLDPHGDLIDQILERLPERRLEDVILLDASDAGRPVGFNILSTNSATEKNLLGSDLVAVFRRLSTSWGDQMTSVLANAILAILESPRGGTLADLRRFLVDAPFRRELLQTVQDPEVIFYWQREFPLLSGRPQASLLTRLDSFLRTKSLRRIVSQRSGGLDLSTVMNKGKVFLAKLSHGAIGEENAYLLGTLLVSKFHQLALARQELRQSQRRPFYLYIDEFHNFITPSMATILAGARKYKLGLVLAHQSLSQLARGDNELLSAVLSNPCTRVCFRVGEDDARKLAEGFSFFVADDLKSLGVGEAIARIDQAQFDFNLRTKPLSPMATDIADARRERIVALSREKYGLKPEESAAPDVVAIEKVGQPVEKLRTAIPEPAPGKRVRAVPDRAPEPPTMPVPEPPLLGRGGRQHKYLQQLIKSWAEDRGFRAVIEKPIADGAGSVDLALERDGYSLACEISVTSTASQELANVRKCLDAGFNEVVVLASESKLLSKARRLIESAVDSAALERVHFFSPDELFVFLEGKVTSPDRETTSRGYRVKVQYRPMETADQANRRQAVAGVVLQSVRRLREDE